MEHNLDDRSQLIERQQQLVAAMRGERDPSAVMVIANELRGIAEQLRRLPQQAGERATRTRIGLGDYTERILSRIGITPDRYIEAKERFGLAPTCNCTERKEWLNRVGQYFGIA